MFQHIHEWCQTQLASDLKPFSTDSWRFPHGEGIHEDGDHFPRNHFPALLAVSASLHLCLLHLSPIIGGRVIGWGGNDFRRKTTLEGKLDFRVHEYFRGGAGGWVRFLIFEIIWTCSLILVEHESKIVWVHYCLAIQFKRWVGGWWEVRDDPNMTRSREALAWEWQVDEG